MDSEAIELFNGEKKLLWWKGEAYVPTPETALTEDQQENAVTKESKSLVEGSWRRMFELDLRKDEADFSSKVNDKELKELQVSEIEWCILSMSFLVLVEVLLNSGRFSIELWSFSITHSILILFNSM